MANHRIGWTKSPVTTANTNRDGSGTVELIYKVTNPAGVYLDSVNVESFGTNVASEAVLLGSNGQGLANDRNNFLLGNALLTATTLGTPLATDRINFHIGAWFDFDYELYAQVHVAQAAGRQFIAFSDSTYQEF